MGATDAVGIQLVETVTPHCIVGNAGDQISRKAKFHEACRDVGRRSAHGDEHVCGPFCLCAVRRGKVHPDAADDDKFTAFDTIECGHVRPSVLPALAVSSTSG